MIKIREYYHARQGTFDFEYDKIAVNNRPAWIKLIANEEKIKFLKVETETGRFFYTSFIENYYLVENASSEEIGIFYNVIGDIYQEMMQSHKIIGNLIEGNLSASNLSKQVSILSIAAGSAIELEQVLKRGYKNVTLLDVSRHMLNIARQNPSYKNCTFILADFLKADFKKKKYRILICSMGIHYFYGQNLHNFLLKCGNILKENGEIHIINISIPLPDLQKHFKTITLKDYEIIDKNNKKIKIIYYIGKKYR